MEATATSRPRILNTEELLKRIETEKQKRQEKARSARRPMALLVAVAVMGVAILGLGAGVFLLKGELMALRSEVGELKGFKSQMVTMDPKLKLTLLEGKVDQVKADGEKAVTDLVGQLAAVKEEIEALKAAAKKGRR